MERVELPRPLAIQLLHAALQAPGVEVCGLVAARDSMPVRVIPVRNVATDPRNLFEMDARELIDAAKAMRANGEELFAIYHSHPDAAPVPTRTDLERSGHPEKLHLIISLQVKGVLQMRGWRFNGETSEAIEIGVQEET